MEREPLVINGAQGEGGGALFRTALSMSALTQIPVRIHHVRGGTRKPGVTSEDLTFLQMVEVVSSGSFEGDLGAEEVTFVPKRSPRPLRGEFDIRSHEEGSIPGNALMLAESILPVIARAGAYSSFSVKGETYNNHTMTFDAFNLGSLALHAKQGLVVFAAQNWAGFGYAGRGEVTVEVEPSALQGFDWTKRGELKSIEGVVAHHGSGKDAPQRALKALEAGLVKLDADLEIIESPVDSRENGLHIALVAKYERGIGVGSCMAAKGVRIESVCEAAISNLKSFMDSDATLDPYLADQALITAALSGEVTSFKTQKVTQRLQTMAYVIRQFMPIPITILGRVDEPGTVKIG